MIAAGAASNDLIAPSEYYLEMVPHWLLKEKLVMI